MQYKVRSCLFVLAVFCSHDAQIYRFLTTFSTWWREGGGSEQLVANAA